MKIIKLYEEYTEDTEIVSKLQNLIRGYVKLVKNWFTTGTFSNQKVTLMDIQISEASSTSKRIIVEFNDEFYMYHIILTIRMEDYDRENMKYTQGLLIIKKYSMNLEPEDSLSASLVDIWESEGLINLSEFNEDRILEIINELDNENQAQGTNPDKNSELGSDNEDSQEDFTQEEFEEETDNDNFEGGDEEF